MDSTTRTTDIETLNDLISLCLDSAKGYLEAANTSKNSSLNELFRTRSQERSRIASEMQAEVRKLGGNPAEHGTMAGAAHRVMMDVMALVGNDTKVAINEVERGEDVIKSAFEKRMTMEGICDSVRSLITQCYSSIKAGHDQISALKQATA
jgi:uncharacterized protein (TIGR02284 family)